MGDFYEAFDDDAARLAETLGIALTSRPLGKSEGRVPMAGIPHHALERYLDQLVTAGLRVALAEQVEPAGRGLVERRVLRVVTPGTVESGVLLAEGSHNWLVALAPEAAARRRGGDEERRWGLAACDATTGELECQLVAEGALGGELARLAARELLLPEGAAGALPEDLAPEARRTARPARAFAPAAAARALCERYGVASLDGFGLAGLDAAVGAAGALLGYLEESWPQALRQLRTPRTPRPGEFVALDAQTRRTLELFESTGGPESTLLGTLDRTLTGPGARLLRERLGRPLRDAAAAEARLDELAAWLEAPLARSALRRALRGLPDLERLLGRVRAGSAGPRQLLQLRRGLERLPELAAQARAAGGAAGRSPPISAARARPPRRSRRRWPTILPRPARASRCGRARTPSSTRCARSPPMRVGRSRRWRRRSASAAGCAASRSATTASSATTWSCRARSPRRRPRSTSRARRWRTRSASATAR